MNILSLIERQVVNKSKHAAMIVGNDQVSYQKLWQDSHHLVYKLKQFPNNAKIGIAVENPISFIKWYVAILINKQIPCVIDPHLNKDKLDCLIEEYNLDGLINNKSNVFKYNMPLKDKLENILHIGFTSGTTGLPKAYLRNHESWVKSFEYNDMLIDNNIDVLVAPGPHAHSLSLYVMIYALCTGRAFIGQVQFDTLSLSKVLQQNTDSKAMFIVPTMLHSMMNHNLKLNKVETIFTSGSKLSLPMFNKFKELYPEIKLIEFFGSSEASFISYNIDGKAAYNSVGYLFPSVKVKLKDKDQNNIGKLYVKSDMTFSGYLDDNIEVNWVKVGDWASLSENGELYLYGRESNRLIIGGRNIYPEIIEQELVKLDGIDEVMILSEKHNKFGEIAVLLYKGSTFLSHVELKRTLLSIGLNRYEIPSKLIKIQKFLYTSSHKIARNLIEEAYKEGGAKWKQLL